MSVEPSGRKTRKHWTSSPSGPLVASKPTFCVSKIIRWRSQLGSGYININIFSKYCHNVCVTILPRCHPATVQLNELANNLLVNTVLYQTGCHGLVLQGGSRLEALFQGAVGAVRSWLPIFPSRGIGSCGPGSMAGGSGENDSWHDQTCINLLFREFSVWLFDCLRCFYRFYSIHMFCPNTNVLIASSTKGHPVWAMFALRIQYRSEDPSRSRTVKREGPVAAAPASSSMESPAKKPKLLLQLINAGAIGYDLFIICPNSAGPTTYIFSNLEDCKTMCSHVLTTLLNLDVSVGLTDLVQSLPTLRSRWWRAVFKPELRRAQTSAAVWVHHITGMLTSKIFKAFVEHHLFVGYRSDICTFRLFYPILSGWKNTAF